MKQALVITLGLIILYLLIKNPEPYVFISQKLTQGVKAGLDSITHKG